MNVNDLIKPSKKSKPVEPVTLDRSVCTVIGSLPFRLQEQKPGLFPFSMFTLPPIKSGEVAHTLIVNEGFYFRYVGEGKSIEQYEKAEVIARSIVNDYVNAQLGLDLSNDDLSLNAQPALFWVYGAHTDEIALDLFADKIELALTQQVNWFKRLIAMADDDWNKYRQHKMISGLQRFAAQTLGYNSEWTNIQSIANQPENCPACKSLIPSGSIVCQICRTIINPAEYQKLGLKQAG